MRISDTCRDKGICIASWADKRKEIIEVGKEVVQFADRNNEGRYGQIVREYGAFEGGTRYIIVDETNGREYRCIKKNGKFVEYVA